MKVTYRIPLQTPHAYLEATRDTETDAEMDEAGYAALATDALLLEQAIVAIIGDDRPFRGGLVAEAERAGAALDRALGGTPSMGTRPAPPAQRGQGQPTGYASPSQQDAGCRACGGALGPVKQTSAGRARECLQEHGECKNDRGYPTTAWLDQAPRGRR